VLLFDAHSGERLGAQAAGRPHNVALFKSR